jgi:hypothetical protein
VPTILGLVRPVMGIRLIGIDFNNSTVTPNYQFGFCLPCLFNSSKSNSREASVNFFNYFIGL